MGPVCVGCLLRFRAAGRRVQPRSRVPLLSLWVRTVRLSASVLYGTHCADRVPHPAAADRDPSD
eukprot:2374402-Rhodomonas_salina.7